MSRWFREASVSAWPVCPGRQRHENGSGWDVDGHEFDGSWGVLVGNGRARPRTETKGKDIKQFRLIEKGKSLELKDKVKAEGEKKDRRI